MTAEIGIVQSSENKKNKDGLLPVPQLNLICTEPDDTRTVQLTTLAGIDSNPPPLSAATILNIKGYQNAVAVDDNVAKENGPGEISIYASILGNKVSEFKVGVDGIITIDNPLFSLGVLIKEMNDNVKDLLAETKAIITTGSPSSQSVSAASQVLIQAVSAKIVLTQAKLDQLID